jgi:integrase
MIRRENWLLTEKYLKEGIREEGTRISDDSISRCEFNLKHLLIWADDKPFAEAFVGNKKTYCSYVAELPARRGEGNLAQESQKKIINDAKRFLTWKNEETTSKAEKISPKTIRQLVPPKITHDTDPISVSIDEMMKLATFDCGDSLVYLRDLAAMSFVFLSGARAGAIKSAPIKAIDLENESFYQFPEIGVKTKNGKRAETYLLPIPELVTVVKRWDDYVRANLSKNSLWYAPLEGHWGTYDLKSIESDENCDITMGKRFHEIYKKMGMADLYKSPHKFRHGHAVYGISRCENMSEYQTLSRNLMHSSIEITDQIYSDIGSKERKKTISKFTLTHTPVVDSELLNKFNDTDDMDKIKAIAKIAESIIGKW